MPDFRARFTKWYYHKGYRAEYIHCDYGDGIAEVMFICPLWVRLLAEFFFSPSIYYYEYYLERFKQES